MIISYSLLPVLMLQCCRWNCSKIVDNIVEVEVVVVVVVVAIEEVVDEVVVAVVKVLLVAVVVVIPFGLFSPV